MSLLCRKILSGAIPFSHCTRDNVVIRAIMEKERPPKEPPASPSGVSYVRLWEVAEQAWAEAPADRPQMSELVMSLQPPPVLNLASEGGDSSGGAIVSSPIEVGEGGVTAAPSSATVTKHDTPFSTIFRRSHSLPSARHEFRLIAPKPQPQRSLPLYGRIAPIAVGDSVAEVGAISKDFQPIPELVPCVAMLKIVSP